LREKSKHSIIAQIMLKLNRQTNKMMNVIKQLFTGGAQMQYKRRAFKETDFIRVGEFLRETYSKSSSNWHIDRWNFCRYSAQVWLDVFSTWPETVGLWVDEEDNIIAVVNSEAGINGEAFFQLKNMEYTYEFLEEMIEFAEENLSIVKNNERNIYLRVNNNNGDKIREILKKRNYSIEDWKETDAAMNLDQPFNAEIPANFKLCDSSKVDEEQQGLAHGRAFCGTESDNPENLKERIASYKGLKSAPDYNQHLDLCILDDNDEIASFATVWYDEYNQIAILEPVGTVLKHRKKGLGKAVIYEGINRVKALGAKKIHVGSDQEFYRAIGFSTEFETEVWHKRFEVKELMHL